MRIISLFILLVCLLLLSPFDFAPKQASGQPSPTAAWNELVKAYNDVQRVDSLGPSDTQISSLISELNVALAYYENASKLASENNATGATTLSDMSIRISSDVSARATTLSDSLELQILIREIAAYSAAAGVSLVSAFFIVEFHRIRRFLQRGKIRSRDPR